MTAHWRAIVGELPVPGVWPDAASHRRVAVFSVDCLILSAPDGGADWAPYQPVCAECLCSEFCGMDIV